MYRRHLAGSEEREEGEDVKISREAQGIAHIVVAILQVLILVATIDNVCKAKMIRREAAELAAFNRGVSVGMGSWHDLNKTDAVMAGGRDEAR